MPWPPSRRGGGIRRAGIKKVSDVAIGDTLTDDKKARAEALPGFKEIKPMVFAGLYPVTRTSTRSCGTPSRSCASTTRRSLRARNVHCVGFGFRCGFPRPPHMEIVQERLEREFDLELLVTAPAVRYP
jgi:GTP-binding protein LepA